jgi:hypothetical protein
MGENQRPTLSLTSSDLAMDCGTGGRALTVSGWGLVIAAPGGKVHDTGGGSDWYGSHGHLLYHELLSPKFTFPRF